MEKLTKLIQDDDGDILKENIYINPSEIKTIGKIKTLMVQTPCLDISEVIDEMTERNSYFIPKLANAYVASDFNGSTQHVRNLEGNEKMFSIYAIQFYYFTEE